MTSSLALADWEKIISSADNEVSFYVSSENIKKTHSTRLVVWEVVNHKTPTDSGYLSAKLQQEYDCYADKVRMLFMSTHSETFGKGETIHLADNLKLPWHKIPKDSVADVVKKYACARSLIK